MKEFEILSCDTVAAVWRNGTLEVLDDARLPLYLKRVSNVEKWLETRAIDTFNL